MNEDDVALELFGHPRFEWREGMRCAGGRRIVDLELWDDRGEAPDVVDPATAGVLLDWLAETGRLTDVVRQDGEWIVAVDQGEEGLQGFAADTLGEASAHALLAAWALPDIAG